MVARRSTPHCPCRLVPKRHWRHRRRSIARTAFPAPPKRARSFPPPPASGKAALGARNPCPPPRPLQRLRTASHVQKVRVVPDPYPPEKITVTPTSFVSPGDKAVQTKGPGAVIRSVRRAPVDDDDDLQLTSYANGCCALRCAASSAVRRVSASRDAVSARFPCVTARSSLRRYLLGLRPPRAARVPDCL
eukprot:scaffold20098_cov104-Isochrysis_galbana.AAC.2